MRDRRVFSKKKSTIMTKGKQKSDNCSCKANSFTEDRQKLQEINFSFKKLLKEVTNLKYELAIYSFIHAYELMLGLHVFRQTGPPRRVDCLAPPSVCHIKTEASR